MVEYLFTKDFWPKNKSVVRNALRNDLVFVRDNSDIKLRDLKLLIVAQHTSIENVLLVLRSNREEFLPRFADAVETAAIRSNNLIEGINSKLKLKFNPEISSEIFHLYAILSAMDTILLNILELCAECKSRDPPNNAFERFDGLLEALDLWDKREAVLVGMLDSIIRTLV